MSQFLFYNHFKFVEKYTVMKTTIKIQNLKCGGCANSITKKLSKISSISNVKVNVEETEVELHRGQNQSKPQAHKRLSPA